MVCRTCRQHLRCCIDCRADVGQRRTQKIMLEELEWQPEIKEEEEAVEVTAGEELESTSLVVGRKIVGKPE